MENSPKSEIVFYRGGLVDVNCDHAQFTKIHRLIWEELGEVPTDDVRHIYVNDKSRQRPPPSWGRDRIALIGFGIVAFIILFVFVAGFAQIASWWWPNWWKYLMNSMNRT
jgi:hypothetical protein